VVSSETGEGPKKAIVEMTKAFEQKYPNVTVKVSYRAFDSWIKQVKLSLASKNPPDVVAGNQGYQVDGELVKAGLILPLAKYAKAYGWEPSFSPQSLQQFKWSPDGTTFGEGTLYGIAQPGQSTGVFANTAKLQKAGVDPAALRTFADFDAALPKIKASLPADGPVIMLGNKEQYEALHLWGMIRGAYTPAQEIRDWIFYRSGKTFDTPGNRQALAKLKECNDKGYLGRGDDYNGRGEQDAATLFARGQGAFMLAGKPASRELVNTTQVPAILDATAKPTQKFGQEDRTSAPLPMIPRSSSSPFIRRTASTASPPRGTECSHGSGPRRVVEATYFVVRVSFSVNGLGGCFGQ